MSHLTPTGYVTAGVAILGAGVFVGWGAGRAYQRAADAWWRFRGHIALTRGLLRGARSATGEAAGIVILAALFVAAAVFAVYLLTTGGS